MCDECLVYLMSWGLHHPEIHSYIRSRPCRNRNDSSVLLSLVQTLLHFQGIFTGVNVPDAGLVKVKVKVKKKKKTKKKKKKNNNNTIHFMFAIFSIVQFIKAFNVALKPWPKKFDIKPFFPSFSFLLFL